MSDCHSQRFMLRTAALALALGMLAPAVQAQPGNGGIDADKARVIEYWDQGRRQAARPRDLVIDPRGLGYLRQANGALEPYGHQITAEQAAVAPNPAARPAGGDDSTPPVVTAMSPGAGDTIGYSATFSATVSDDGSGVRAVDFIVRYPDGITTQTFPAIQGANNTWSRTLEGFSNGNWSWTVAARDNARKGGNTATAGPVGFTVDIGGGGGGGGGGGSGTVTDAEWTSGGAVQTAAGRIYFEMPNNQRRRGPWGGYVCSGTVVTEAVSGRSVILTAAHCVYDDVNKAYARNVLFIPNQAHTSGSRTDTNCSNDPLGCWVPSFGVVDTDWTTRAFPDNIPWDYAYYVVADSGAHQGAAAPAALDAAVQPLTISFGTPYTYDNDPGAASIDFTHALGYSYSDDPKLMYCAEDMTQQGADNWWLASCGLSGGSSGGPWIQPMTSGSGPVISVNSWGYSTLPGMAGPLLHTSSASCVFGTATTTPWTAIDPTDGEAGVSTC